LCKRRPEQKRSKDFSMSPDKAMIETDGRKRKEVVLFKRLWFFSHIHQYFFSFSFSFSCPELFFSPVIVFFCIRYIWKKVFFFSLLYAAYFSTIMVG
jgi:hypothetical protein